VIHERFLLSGKKGLGECAMTYTLVNGVTVELEMCASLERNCSTEEIIARARQRERGRILLKDN
jgi:hypothetical protein